MTSASDRLCIASNGTFNSLLSITDAISCCPVCGSCVANHGALFYFNYFVHGEGVVTGGRDGCQPYTMPLECGSPCRSWDYAMGEPQRVCQRECQYGYAARGYAEDKHRGSLAYSIYGEIQALNGSEASNEGGGFRRMPSLTPVHHPPSIYEHLDQASGGGNLTHQDAIDLIRKEIYLHGPVVLHTLQLEEFNFYSSGVFHPYPVTDLVSRMVDGHAVRVIGWGFDQGVVDGGFGDGWYWLAVNSFGDKWGERGLFRIDSTLLDRVWGGFYAVLP